MTYFGVIMFLINFVVHHLGVTLLLLLFVIIIIIIVLTALC